MNIEIVFDKARLADVKLAPAAASYKIKVVAIATPKVAKAIGAPWLLDKGALVRSGFSLTKSDFVLNSARLKHSLDKTQLEVVSDKISQFKLFRTGDGKKDAKRLMICFVAHVVGAPFLTLEHWLKVGEGEGTCTLLPMQAELPLAAGQRPPAVRKNGKQLPLTPAKAILKKTAEPKPGGLAPNAEGVFMSAKAFTRYKGKDKRFHAQLYVVEVAGGFVSGYDVQAGHSARAAMPSLRMPRHSAAQARIAAARVVMEVAGNVARTGTASHKTEAQKMADWAKGEMQAASRLETAQADDFGKLFEGLGHSDAPAMPRSGKDASTGPD